MDSEIPRAMLPLFMQDAQVFFRCFDPFPIAALARKFRHFAPGAGKPHPVPPEWPRTTGAIFPPWLFLHGAS
jgi:hypothetical protein